MFHVMAKITAPAFLPASQAQCEERFVHLVDFTFLKFCYLIFLAFIKVTNKSKNMKNMKSTVCTNLTSHCPRRAGRKTGAVMVCPSRHVKHELEKKII